MRVGLFRGVIALAISMTASIAPVVARADDGASVRLSVSTPLRSSDRFRGHAVASAGTQVVGIDRPDMVGFVSDRLGDAAVFEADIIGASVRADGNGSIVASIDVRTYSAVNDFRWTVYSSGPSWGFDTNFDGFEDYSFQLYSFNGQLAAGLFDANDQLRCTSTSATSDSVNASYTAAFDASCIGSPASFQWYAWMLFGTDTDNAIDEAPDTGWAGPVLNTPQLTSALVPTVPARLADTRPGEVTVDRQFEGLGRRAAGATLDVVVAGRGGVPADATAVMLNVTAVLPGAAGFLTAWPCGTEQPLASNVNYDAGQVVPNAVLAKVGTGGKVCVYTSSASDIVVDVNGYVPVGGAPVPLVPARLLDSRRIVGHTVDGLFMSAGQRPAGSVTTVDVTGRGGVPTVADAVMLNVTVVSPTAPGYLTVWPCGQPQPLASNVNYQANQVVPNAVLAKIGAGGNVCIYTLAPTELVVDVNGFVPVGTQVTSMTPARLLESRPATQGFTVDGLYLGLGRRPAGSVTEFVATRATVPGTASAVMLNVTAINPSADGYLTVFPCGGQQPNASSVNYRAGQIVPNAVLAKVGDGGKVCVFTLAETDLLVDVAGYV